MLTTAVVAAMLAAAPAPAGAQCGSSTASGASNFADSPSDAGPGAPEVVLVNNALDSSCTLRTEVLLTPLALAPGQHLVVRYDRDDPAPGEAADLRVVVDAAGATLDDGVHPPQPLPTFGQYGFAVTLDQLGVARSPAALGVAATGVFDPTPAGPDGDESFDDAPDAGTPMHRIHVSFSPPPPAAPAAPPAPAAAPAAKKAYSCVVPRVRGLTVRKAKARLRKAGCKYRVRGRGRVRWTSPRAGKLTRKTVRVRAKPRRARR